VHLSNIPVQSCVQKSSHIGAPRRRLRALCRPQVRSRLHYAVAPHPPGTVRPHSLDGRRSSGFWRGLVFRLQRFDPGSSVQIGRPCRSSSVQCGFATAPFVFLPGSARARIIAPNLGDGAAVGGLSTPEVWEHPSEWLKVAIDRRDPGSGTND
jgi:hypothetical protein